MTPINRTAERQTRVRYGFSDADTFGHGYACAATGNLDAPQHYPQGSIRLHCTHHAIPAQSLGNRDWCSGGMVPGSPHDGPETAADVVHWG